MTVVLPARRGAPLVMRLRLAAEIVAAYARARRRLRGSDLPSTLAALRARPVTATVEPAAQRTVAVRLTKAVLRTLAWVPGDTRCLMRSLTIAGLLARRGIDFKVVLAVRPGQSQEFGAHAWVELDGRPLFDPAEPPFERLVEL